MESVQTTLRSTSVQPSVLRLAACAGTAMIAASTVTKWRSSATAIEDGAVFDDDSQLELDPSPAKPVIFALGFASAIMQSMKKAENKDKPSKTKETLRRESVPVNLDISDDEYNALSAVLKRTEKSSKIDPSKLDPIRRLLKIEAHKSNSASFRKLIDDLERKTISDVSGIQRMINWIGNPGRSKYDCVTDLAAFSEPPAAASQLKHQKPPKNNKFDFLVRFFKGRWRAPKKEQLTYWDPVSIIYMLIDRSVNIQFENSRFVKKLIDFSSDGSNRYDPLDGISIIRPLEGRQKYDPIQDFLQSDRKTTKTGVDTVRSLQDKMLPTTSTENDDAATDEIIAQEDESESEGAVVDPTQNRATLPVGQPTVEKTQQSGETVTEKQTAILTPPEEQMSDDTHSIDKDPTAILNPPTTDGVVDNEAKDVDSMKQRFDSTISLLQDAKQTLCSDLKTEIKDYKEKGHGPQTALQFNGNELDRATSDIPVADRMQETLSQITSELTLMSSEIYRLYQ